MSCTACSIGGVPENELIKTKGIAVKPKTTTELAKLAIEALKVPHIAVLVGTLGMAVIFTYLK